MIAPFHILKHKLILLFRHNHLCLRVWQKKIYCYSDNPLFYIYSVRNEMLAFFTEKLNASEVMVDRVLEDLKNLRSVGSEATVVRDQVDLIKVCDQEVPKVSADQGNACVLYIILSILSVEEVSDAPPPPHPHHPPPPPNPRQVRAG